MNEVEKAYIAGLIDGEGCIRIAKGKNKKESSYIRYRAFLSITNTNQELIEWCKNITNLGFTRKVVNTKHLNWKDRYDFILQDKIAISLIQEVYPFLKIKNKQADILLRFNAGTISKEDAYTACLSLNKKGK